ncbi:MAG: hypothetical protein AB7S69_03710 [Salinivirgaceae bacterium]|jgi:hypothetical protein
MKVKEFTRFHLAPEHAIKLLTEDIHNFLKNDKSIELISISHSIIDSQSLNEHERFMASALLCYK